MKLQPVIAPIRIRAPLRSADHVREQHRCARLALRECAKRSGAPCDDWEKDAGGVPKPNAGFFWSVSHKRWWAAAVIADRPVGIDIEHIVMRPRRLHEALAHPEEWALMGSRSWRAFYRLWTAKEAALKAHGVGIAGFAACRLIEVPGEHHLTVEYDGQRRLIEHFYYNDHVAAVTCDSATVNWCVVETDR